MMASLITGTAAGAALRLIEVVGAKQNPAVARHPLTFNVSFRRSLIDEASQSSAVSECVESIAVAPGERCDFERHDDADAVVCTKLASFDHLCAQSITFKYPDSDHPVPSGKREVSRAFYSAEIRTQASQNAQVAGRMNV